MSNSKLVWSDDPKDQLKVEGKSAIKQPLKQEAVESRNFVAVFRIEKNGRGGKTVTIIDQLPKNEIFLKDLCKEIKSKCGVGGTYSMDGKEGLLEIQGDKRDQIKSLFDKKSIKYKGM